MNRYEWHLEEPELTEVICGYRKKYKYTDTIYFTEDEEYDEINEYASKPCIVTYLGLDKKRHVSEIAAVYYDNKWWWFHDEERLESVVVPIIAWTEMPEIYKGTEEPEWR